MDHITVTVRGVKGSGKTTITRLIEDGLKKAGFAVLNDATFKYGKCSEAPLEQCVESLKRTETAIRLDIDTIKPPSIDCEQFVLHQVVKAPKKVDGARSPHWDVEIGDRRVAMIQGLLMHHIVRRGAILFVRADEIKVGDQIFVTRNCIRDTCEN